MSLPLSLSPAFSEEHAFQLSSSSRQPDNTIPYVVGCHVTLFSALWPLTFDLPLQVMECDTLNTIALKFETTPGKLAQINKKPLGSSFVLFPGDVSGEGEGEGEGEREREGEGRKLGWDGEECCANQQTRTPIVCNDGPKVDSIPT